MIYWKSPKAIHPLRLTVSLAERPPILLLYVITLFTVIFSGISQSNIRVRSPQAGSVPSFQKPPKVIQTLRQTRMRKHCILQFIVRQPAHHSQLDHTHDLTSGQPETRKAQDLLCIGIDDGLHEPIELVPLYRMSHIGHGHLRDLDVPRRVESACIFLRQPDAAELRIHEHAVRDQSVLDRSLFRLVRVRGDEIVPEDAKVVVRDVRLSRAAFDVAQRIHILGRSLQMLVDFDVAVRVDLDSRHSQIQSRSIGHPARRGEHVRAQQSLGAAVLLGQRDHDLAQRDVGDFPRLRPEVDVDSFVDEDLAHLLRHIRVLPGQELHAVLYKADSRTEALHHLRKFDPDRSTTDYDQMPRDLAQFHDGRRIEQIPRDRVRVFHLQWRRRASGVDEDLIGVERFLHAGLVDRDFDGLGTGESRRAQNQFQVGRVLDPVLAPRAETVHDVALALPDRLHVEDEAGLFELHPVTRRSTGQVRDHGTGDHGLCRCASFVDTCPTHVCRFDERRAPASFGECLGQWSSALAGADHDGVEVCRHCSSLLPC